MEEFRIVQSSKGMKKELHLLGKKLPSSTKNFSKNSKKLLI